MSMHKGIIGQSKSGASVKQDVTLADYIKRKTECCGNPLRGCKDCPPYKSVVPSKAIRWCAEMFEAARNNSWPYQIEFRIDKEGYAHIVGYGSELVLCPNGNWFMNDTSGG